MTQYDSIGSEYNLIKQLPWGKLETYNFRRQVEPLVKVPGTKVLDLDCGAGFYSQLLVEWGASSVVGMDVSPAMVEGAKAQLSRTPFASSCEFVVGDGSNPRAYSSGGKEEDFDVVIGAWFLNYANGLEEMTTFFKTISLNLKPGGVFVATCPHPTNDVAELAAGINKGGWKKTGLYYNYSTELEDGTGYNFRVHAEPKSPDGSEAAQPAPIEFDSYHLKKSVWEEAARAGGMKGKIEWQEVSYLEDGWRTLAGLQDEEEWNTFQQYPQMAILRVWKD